MKTKTKRSADRAERMLIYFSTAQRRALVAASKRLRISQAALFRRGIDLVIADASKRRARS